MSDTERLVQAHTALRMLDASGVNVFPIPNGETYEDQVVEILDEFLTETPDSFCELLQEQRLLLFLMARELCVEEHGEQPTTSACPTDATCHEFRLVYNKLSRESKVEVTRWMEKLIPA